MNRQEAVDVLETIKLLYPKYELTMEKGNILISQLEEMDYSLVMDNLRVRNACSYVVLVV